MRLTAGLARFVVSAGLAIEHDPAQDDAVLLRDRLAKQGYPDGWREPFEALLASLRVAPVASR